MTTILIKRSFAAGIEPSSLAPGELAVNVADRKVWIGDAASVPVLINDKAEFAGYLPLAGGTMTGAIVGPVDADTIRWEEGPLNASVSSDGTKVVLSVNDGDATFTLQVDKIIASRPIELPVHALEDNHAARVDYVNQRIAALAIPTPQVDKLGGVFAAEAEPGFAQYGISTSGAPIFKDIAVPYPAPTKLGGLFSTTALSGKYISAINTDGTVAYGDMPAGVDLSAYLPLAGGTMTGTIKVPDTINAIQTASGFNIIGNAAGMYVRSGTTNLWAYGVSALTAYKPIALPADPTAALHAATKQYVDTKAGAYLPLAGGTMTGVISMTGSGTTPMRFGAEATGNYNVTMLAAEGGMVWQFNSTALFTLTKTELQANKPLLLSADPTAALEAATKQYVDSKASTYTLPTASATVLGGIKIGAGLAIDAGGVVSASGGSSVTNPVAGSQAGLILWVGTQAAYDAIATKDSKTIYNITA